MSSLNKLLREKLVQKPGYVPCADVERQLTRLTLASMLWEDQFYMDGETHAELVARLVKVANPKFVQELATAARTKFKLRHVPLLLLRELARNGSLAHQTLTNCIERPDEIGEFLSIYWKDGRTPVANQVKKGIANAFHKFNEYQLAKWDKNSAAVRLRDAMFLARPKPRNEQEADLFRRLANDQLETPDTWETSLSAGTDKKETWERLMCAGKLGALAFLRNLRNMYNSGVDTRLIESYGDSVSVEKVLPFRFIAAWRQVPQFEVLLERMMLRALESQDKIPGHTVIMVDVSGSMFGATISAKSDLERFDAAAALAMLLRSVCEKVTIFTFSDNCVEVRNPQRGFGLVNQLSNSQYHSGTRTGEAVASVNGRTTYDRLVLFTDEQANGFYSSIPNPINNAKAYSINVGGYESEHRVDHTTWVSITGFSEAVIEYIKAFEVLDV